MGSVYELRGKLLTIAPADSTQLAPKTFVDSVDFNLAASSKLAPESLDRLSALHRRFAQFLTSGLGIGRMDEVRTEHVQAFAEARTKAGGLPSLATIHLRRAAVRQLFREARSMGYQGPDPAADLFLPPRSTTWTRPLTDSEVELCRSFSMHSLSDARVSSVWALAETTVRCSELASLRLADIDLEAARLHIPGSSKTLGRVVLLSPWASNQLESFLEGTKLFDPGATLGLTRATSPASATASAHAIIHGIFKRAGINDLPGVRPNSVAAWRGTQALAAGDRLEDVAYLLGLRSLDRTAAFIGFDWRAAR